MHGYWRDRLYFYMTLLLWSRGNIPSTNTFRCQFRVYIIQHICHILKFSEVTFETWLHCQRLCIIHYSAHRTLCTLFGFSQHWIHWMFVTHRRLKKRLILFRRHDTRHFLERRFCIFIQISLKFLSVYSMDNKLSLLRVMACRRTGDKSLPKSMMTHFTDHTVANRSQYVKYRALSL